MRTPTGPCCLCSPMQGPPLKDLVQRMGGLEIGSIRTNSKLATTSIFIPKFKLNFKIDLKQQMKQLGVRDLFSRSANLSGISNKEELYASEGVHQAFIVENEEGTEAAAATAVVVSRLSASSVTPRQFRADRPFLFMVYDFELKVTLFAGKVVNPNIADGI